MAILRGLVYLKNGKWQAHGKELLDECEGHLGLNGPLLRALHDLRGQKGAPKGPEIRDRYREMMELLEGLAAEVDGW